MKRISFNPTIGFLLVKMHKMQVVYFVNFLDFYGEILLHVMHFLLDQKIRGY